MQTTRPRKERVYVKVTSDFDTTGHVNPKSITWADGRVFWIEWVHDFRPANTYGQYYEVDRYTVKIKGQLRHLYLEHVAAEFHDRLGRWFVEAIGS